MLSYRGILAGRRGRWSPGLKEKAPEGQKGRCKAAEDRLISDESESPVLSKKGRGSERQEAIKAVNIEAAKRLREPETLNI